MQGRELKAIREALGMGQRMFAAQLGMTQTYISQMELDKRPIEERTRLAAAALLLLSRQFTVAEVEGKYRVAKWSRKPANPDQVVTSIYGHVILGDDEYSTREAAQAEADRLNAEAGAQP